MKYTIEGFSQEAAMKFQNTEVINGKVVTQYLDCTDLAILRWFVDFYKFMRKMTIDGQEYAFVNYQRLVEDMPLIRVSKKAFAERMRKMAKMGILVHQHVKEGGSFSVYILGEGYNMLVDTKAKQKEKDVAAEDSESPKKEEVGVRLNGQGAQKRVYPVSLNVHPSPFERTTNSNQINNQIYIYNNIINNIFSSHQHYPFGAALNETIKNWLEYKIQKHQPYGERGLRSLVTQIMNNVGRYGEDAVEEIILESMSSNYTGIIWEKLKKQQAKANEQETNQKQYTHESHPWRLANWMSRKLHQLHPSVAEASEDVLQKWSAVFEAMETDDKHEHAEMLSLLRYTYQNEFWKTKITSPWDFRKHYIKILGQAEEEGALKT